MIFASDLDRTLIYSKSFVSDEITEVVVVEKREDKVISYMTEKSIRILSHINEKLMFIPVTTRSMEQFKRISLFQEKLKTKYAVVANGGIILVNGEPDLVWEKKIAEGMKSFIEPEELKKKLTFFTAEDYVSSCRCCDNLFNYIVLKSRLEDQENFKKLIDLCKAYNYEVTLNGRKIYIIPEFINKWSPLEYIMEIEEEKEITAAGDSILDLPMLEKSHRALIPLHGELYKMYKEVVSVHEHMQFTKEEGLKACEEFLSIIDVV